MPLEMSEQGGDRPLNLFIQGLWGQPVLCAKVPFFVFASLAFNIFRHRWIQLLVCVAIIKFLFWVNISRMAIQRPNPGDPRNPHKPIKKWYGKHVEIFYLSAKLPKSWVTKSMLLTPENGSQPRSRLAPDSWRERKFDFLKVWSI